MPHPPTRYRPLALLAMLLAMIAGLAAARPALARPRTILDDAEFRVEAQAGLDKLYDMDFNGADAIFAGISKRYPDHPVGPFLEALSPWWQIQVNILDESRDAAFLKAMDEVLDRCKHRLRKDPQDLDGLFFEAGAHALRGRLYADRGSYFRAARDGQKALSSLQEVHKRDPQNPDLLLGIGLFDYLADVVPKQHPFLRVFTSFFPKGSRERGLAELEQAAEKGQFVSTEAAFSLLQIYFVFEDDYATSLHYARLLRDRYPDNSLFHVYEGRSFARLNLWDDARRSLQEVAERQAEGKPGYRGDVAEQALYLLSRDAVRRRQYTEALDLLQRLERQPQHGREESVYKTLGRLYRGMALDALGQRDEALRFYRLVRSAKGPDSAREIAKNLIKYPYPSG
ncbi:MAG TPA: tetratricopeptide repeat protein [Thermoanaerobaculia bacterium]|nr:tetratricopeptide repeat protein [Thermoanaerobaculia bacterium]